eukprot:9216166-Pyramimonas_sp.AAC.1
MVQALAIAAPRAFPKGSPAHKGCHPLAGPIDEPPYLDNVESDARRGPPKTSQGAAGRMDALYGHVIQHVENELVYLYQVDDPDACRGRADGSSYAWRPIGGPRTGPHPAAG